MNQTRENGKETKFGHDFGPFWHKFFSRILPLLDVIHWCKLSLYAISRKTNESNLKKWQKNTLIYKISETNFSFRVK